MLDALEKSNHFDSNELKDFREKLQYTELARGLKRLQENQALYQKNLVQPDIPKPTRPNTSSTPPELNHSQISALYLYDDTIAPSVVREILALPRATLIEDMVTILRDSIDRFPYFEKLADEEEFHLLYAPTHALMILGELNADEALPHILTFLEAHPDEINLFMEDCWAPLKASHHYKLYAKHWDTCLQWMKKPNIGIDAKSHILQMAWNTLRSSPAQRDTMIQWMSDVLESQLQASPSEQLLDTVLVGEIVELLITAKAEDCLPLIRDAYNASIVSHVFHGTIEQATKAMHSAIPPKRKKTKSMLATYKEWNKEVEDFDDDFSDDFPEPSSLFPTSLSSNNSAFFPSDPEPTEKTPRNAPCPCGSGKKYKRCCMNT